MATRSELRTKVGQRTARSEETNFDSIVNDAFDEFLDQSARAHVYEEMKTTTSFTLSSGSYSVALPSVSLTGFSSTIHKVLGIQARRASGDQYTYPLAVREYTQFDRMFSDRSRSDAIEEDPIVCSIFKGTTFLVQAPSHDSFTILMTTAHMPALTSDSQENPIPALDTALVAYGQYLVWDSVTEFDSADRAFQKALALRGLAESDAEREPAVRNIARPHGSGPMGPGGYRFSLSDLQGEYPGDVS